MTRKVHKYKHSELTFHQYCNSQTFESDIGFCQCCNIPLEFIVWEYGSKIYACKSSGVILCKRCCPRECRRRISSCRKCCEAFESRNELFRHLKKYNHYS